ncbi:hypothetical protein ALC60_02825, partial [Trachymyrmex zeteki]
IVHTKPATIRPPIVPCDVTDATAIRVARDQSSDLVGKFGVLETHLRESMLSAGNKLDILSVISRCEFSMFNAKAVLSLARKFDPEIYRIANIFELVR